MRPAVVAAVQVGASYGVDASDPVLLQETNNTVVWLRPSPVVGKVATRADAKLALRLEHAVATELAALGADIAYPLQGAQPAEDRSSGFVVTLWERLDRVDDTETDGTLSMSLAALHVALAATRTRLPSFRADLSRARHALDDDDFMAALAPHDRAFLVSAYDAGLADIDGLCLDRQRLHGEPHDGNRILTAHGLRWIDFESCCLGPLEWDLAYQPDEVVSAFPEVDHDLLRRLRRLNAARIATWCWGNAHFPEMRWHGQVPSRRAARRARPSVVTCGAVRPGSVHGLMNRWRNGWWASLALCLIVGALSSCGGGSSPAATRSRCQARRLDRVRTTSISPGKSAS